MTLTVEFEPCCSQMEEAVRFGLLELIDGETRLPARALPDVNADATAANVLTGETYNPADFALTMALGLEAYLAGVISTFEPMSSRHPSDCLPIAKAVLEALADWQPEP